MKKTLIIFSILFVFLICMVLLNKRFVVTRTNGGFGEWSEAERQLSGFFPKLRILEDKYRDDAEIQLGLVFLYYMYDTPRDFLVIEPLENVLTIDPSNRPASALLSKLLCTCYTATRRDLLDQLESVVNDAREGNIETLELYKGSDLRQWFKEKNINTVIIRDFELAPQALREKIEEGAPIILAMLNECQSKDLENALYNYLRAHLYFELGEKDKAINEIQGALTKEYLSDHIGEMSKAAARVLREVKFPQRQVELIIGIQHPFAGFLRSNIWERGLARLGKSYEAQRDFKTARRMYRLMISVAKQCQERPESVSESVLGDPPSLTLQVLAQRCIDELEEQMSGEPNE
jgi:tetratricopeptide (TPR) repeat protein